MSAELKILSTGEKTCSKCKVNKPYADFYAHKVHGLNSRCKECHKADCRARRPNHKTNKELAVKRYKKWREGLKADPKRYENYRSKKSAWNKTDKYYDGYFKKRFGISFADFNRMLHTQSGLCANIGCGREIALFPKNNQTKAVVDHNHTTGAVRSLMCFRCNSLLGHIEKDRGVIRGLEDYLVKHS